MISRSVKFRSGDDGNAIFQGSLTLIAFVYGVIALFAAAIFFAPRLVPMLSREFDHPTAELGLLFSFYFAGYVLSLLVGGYL